MKRQSFYATLTLSIALSTGCGSLNMGLPESPFASLPKWGDTALFGGADEETPEPYPTPAKIAATWKPDTLMQPGKTPTRGFGARVFFYDERSRPVPVDGTLIVHGFDDTGNPKDPDVKRFEFTPEQLTRHFSQTDLGASYSVWIPWDAVGEPQRRISLITSFQPVDGPLVQGIQATVVLPGVNDVDEALAESMTWSSQYKRYLDAKAAPPRTHGIASTTIKRGRSPSSVPIDEPGPLMQSPETNIAGGSTPSYEIGRKRTTTQSWSRPNFLPASSKQRR